MTPRKTKENNRMMFDRFLKGGRYMSATQVKEKENKDYDDEYDEDEEDDD